MKKHLLLIGLLLVSLDCPASFNEGVAAYEKGDYQTALKVWKAVAEQKSAVSKGFEWNSGLSKNIAEAQYALGLLYWQGKGVTLDYHEAEKWLSLAAKGGHSDAQLKLAYLYLAGLTGAANVNEAVKWFEQSAQQGNVNAQYNLGLLYFKGSGIAPDQALAKKWLSAAAQQGDSSAKELLARVDEPVTTPPLPIQTYSVATATAQPANTPIPLPASPSKPATDVPAAPQNTSAAKDKELLDEIKIITQADTVTAAPASVAIPAVVMPTAALSKPADEIPAAQQNTLAVSDKKLLDEINLATQADTMTTAPASVNIPAAVIPTVASSKPADDIPVAPQNTLAVSDKKLLDEINQATHADTMTTAPASVNIPAAVIPTVASSKPVVDVTAAPQNIFAAKEPLDEIKVAPQTDKIAPPRTSAIAPAAAIPTASLAATILGTDPIAGQNAPSSTTAGDFTIQLLASSKQNEVAKFVEKWRNDLSPLIMSDKIKNSERVFVVIYGSYPSTAEAAQAIASLPTELRKNKPWAIKLPAATQQQMIANKQLASDALQNTPATNEQLTVTALTAPAAASSNIDQAIDLQLTPASAEPTASLVDSTWHYVDEQWQYDIKFAPNGVLLSTHPKDKSKDNDSWEQDGDKVNFYFNNQFSHFAGSVSGNKLMSGTATTKKGGSWAWKASRAD